MTGHLLAHERCSCSLIVLAVTASDAVCTKVQAVNEVGGEATLFAKPLPSLDCCNSNCQESGLALDKDEFKVGTGGGT